MIPLTQILQLSKKLKTNTTVIAREYLQLLFLQSFYELNSTEKIFFKGGTAIHFLIDGFRFSDDLDFTVQTSKTKVNDLVLKTVEKMQKTLVGLTIKEKKTLLGKTYLLTLTKGLVDFPIFVRLDFSFREKTLQPQKSIIKTEFPIIFASFVYHLGAEEILAEKTRTILTRDKGRDLFDFWFLLKKDFRLNINFIKQKMTYYPKITFSWKKVLNKINNYDFAQFKSDLMPFISLDKRAKIKETFEIIKIELSQEIKKIMEK